MRVDSAVQDGRGDALSGKAFGEERLSSGQFSHAIHKFPSFFVECIFYQYMQGAGPKFKKSYHASMDDFVNFLPWYFDDVGVKRSFAPN